MLEDLIVRTLCDTLPETPADAAYLFAQTEDNQSSVFAAAQHLLEQKAALRICFINTPPMSGYPGFEYWKEALTGRGIDKSKLEPVSPVPAGTDMLHTRIEAESVVNHARQHEYNNVIVVASPFQQTRAFMATVTAATSLYPELKLYSCPGRPLPWQQDVTHSQGKVQNTRAGLIAGEIERIHKYHEKGDLLAVKDVLNYLDKRDNKQ